MTASTSCCTNLRLYNLSTNGRIACDLRRHNVYVTWLFWKFCEIFRISSSLLSRCSLLGDGWSAAEGWVNAVLLSPTGAHMAHRPRYTARRSIAQLALTQWGRGKMIVNLQTSYSSLFSSMETYIFWFKFHWDLFLNVPLSLIWHRFWKWLGTVYATRHYLSDWLSRFMSPCL